MFVFVFDSLDRVVDFKTGLRVPVSFAVQAEALSDALVKLAVTGGDLGWSDDVADYQSDIDAGRVTVLVPTVVG